MCQPEVGWSGELEKQRQISRNLIIVTLSILVVYACISMEDNMEFPKLGNMSVTFSQKMLRRSEETYLTGLVYMSQDQHFSVKQKVEESALRLIPLGIYVEGKEELNMATEDRETYEMILARQASDENAVDENGNLIGQENVQEASGTVEIAMEQLNDFEYLVGNFYTVDGTTMTSPEELNAQKLLSKDMTINIDSDGPKVLIYHTHSQEAFADSVDGDTGTTIMGMGAYLAELLNSREFRRFITKESMI